MDRLGMSGEAPAKILVVDDLPAQRLAIEAALAELGAELIAVGSGADALRILLEHDVAVILLDVNMPEMDGFETAALIRQRPRSRHTPIIFLTAHADELAAAHAYSLGAVDYIFCPFPPETLRAKVRVFVELSKTHERVKREAEQQVALARAEAARVAAEEESGRLRLLAEASRVLTRSLDTTSLVVDLLAFLVPLMADTAAMALVPADGRDAEYTWLDVEAAGRVKRDPVPDARLAAALARVMAGGAAETWTSEDGPRARGLAVPLVARGRTFGAVAAAFRTSPREYRQADVELLRDIVARAAIALDNSRLYREIYERDRQKDEFLAMLSHELRNPVGAIVMAIPLLEGAPGAESAAARARDVVSRQARHLSRLVDDLLDVARLTSGQIVLTRHRVDLAEVVTRAIDTLRMSGQLAHHELATDVRPVIVEADFARIEQVVTNLLVNAVKYTDRGGRIDVGVSGEGRDAVIRVRDTGIGIGAEMLPRLFDLFTQGPQALDRAKGGLGIGLTLVRRLVELHGGRVEAFSEGVGRGSTFTVRLPRAADVPAEEAPRPDERIGEHAALRILIVEDNRDARDMLRMVLESAGHDVREAADGLEALQVAAREKPQVVLIDIGLPGLDGLEVAARLRATVDGSKAVLVAVTGYGQTDDRRRTAEAGFDLHLTKPVDPLHLKEIVALAARHRPQAAALERFRTPSS